MNSRHDQLKTKPHTLTAETTSRKKAVIAILVVSALGAIVGGISKHLEQQAVPAVATANSDREKKEIAPSAPRFQNTESTSAPVGGPPVKASELRAASHLSDILLNDDACRLAELLKSERPLVLLTYFQNTPFRPRYEEYSEMLMGFEVARTPMGTFYLGLAHAHWLQNQGWTNPFKRSFGRAARILLQLARTDHGNAAPAVFALIAIEAALIEGDATIGISEGEKLEAIELILGSTKFDIYTLSYLTELATFDDPSATSLLLRLQHLSELALPNWNEFRVRWSQTQAIRQEDKLRIVDLIAANALQAKKPSHHLGYSYLEHRFAQSLAGGARAYQSPEHIDSAFPSATKRNLKTLIVETKFPTPCADPQLDAATEILREYAKELRRTDAGLGVSF